MQAVLDEAVETQKVMKSIADLDTGFIFIAGPTCSGKTTLAYRLKYYFEYRFETVTVIKQDDYLKDLRDMPRSQRGYFTDSMDAFYVEEMKRDFDLYIKNGKAEIPMYDLASNSRFSAKQYIVKSQITIVEGLHTISLFHGMKNSVYIYLDTPINECLKRRIMRDRISYRIPEDRVKKHFQDCIMPSYEEEILPQRKLHGVIIYDFV